MPLSATPSFPQLKVHSVSDYSRIAACHSSSVLKCLPPPTPQHNNRASGQERKREDGYDGEVQTKSEFNSKTAKDDTVNNKQEEQKGNERARNGTESLPIEEAVTAHQYPHPAGEQAEPR